MASEKALLDQIFNLKFTAKQLQRQAHKCEKEEKAEKMKVRVNLRIVFQPQLFNIRALLLLL